MPLKKKVIEPVIEEPVVETTVESVDEAVEEPVIVEDTSLTKIVDTECLNVRRRTGGEVIGRLYRNQAVTVDNVKGEWAKITSPIKGYCKIEYLK